jgi:hypothetical protein
VKNEEEAAARIRALHKLRTKGLEACVNAAISICEDKNAPANARATASASLMRANSLFAAGPQGQEKQLHEMTAAELKAMGDQLERDRRALLEQLEAEGSGDVFE